jgi:hypothetical protein
MQMVVGHGRIQEFICGESYRVINMEQGAVLRFVSAVVFDVHDVSSARVYLNWLYFLENLC